MADSLKKGDSLLMLENADCTCSNDIMGSDT